MRVIAKSRLRQFWRSRKHDAKIAERDLSAWHKIAVKAEWLNFASVKQTFGSADQVGNCVVFDVGNNRYRLVGRIIYAKGRLYVLKIMDHADYDRLPWPNECGCYKPPPKKPDVVKKATSHGNRGRRGRKGRK